MKCVDTGTLQAYLDRELAEPRLARVAAHVKDCAACGARLERVEAADRQMRARLDLLEMPGSAPVLVVRRSGFGWRWAAVAAALALAVALFFAIRHPAPQRQAVRAAIQAPAAQPVAPAPLPVPRKRVRRHRPAPTNDEFVPLDDADPIQIGMVVRMALPVWNASTGVREIAADVIIGEDGRARAIRFVR